ncbi:hypothetical protein ACB098_09G130300 [Castanea mollissima]
MASEQKQGRSPELRKDWVTNRWVVFSPARAKRPSDFKSKSPASTTSATTADQIQDGCPFCLGHEHLCAPEIFRVPTSSDPDWKIRVIQNLYPALDRTLNDPSAVAPNPNLNGVEVLGGFGFHDVVIETPFHSLQLSDLSSQEISQVLLAYKNRILQLAAHSSIHYVQVFKNHGASAGASLSHSHSQIIGLPVVPPNVSARVDSMKQFFNETGKCSVCEIQAKELLIDESTHFISVVPFAATFPFEIWIIPRDHSSHFHQLDEAKIIPQLTIVAGFEMATGCYINPVFPEDAAKVLREVPNPE